MLIVCSAGSLSQLFFCPGSGISSKSNILDSAHYGLTNYLGICFNLTVKGEQCFGLKDVQNTWLPFSIKFISPLVSHEIYINKTFFLGLFFDF